MKLEKDVNHGGHGEHGEKLACQACLRKRRMGSHPTANQLLSFAVPAVFAVVNLRP